MSETIGKSREESLAEGSDVFNKILGLKGWSRQSPSKRYPQTLETAGMSMTIESETALLIEKGSSSVRLWANGKMFVNEGNDNDDVQYLNPGAYSEAISSIRDSVETIRSLQSNDVSSDIRRKLSDFLGE